MSRASDAALAKVEHFSCACPKGGGTRGCANCREMCEGGYPGRFTPAEARAAIKAGRARDLIAIIEDERLEGNRGVTILRPAIVGWEGLTIHEWEAVRGKCAFLGIRGECRVHGTEFKPLECRVASCNRRESDTQQTRYHQTIGAITAAWRTRKGKEVVRLWREAVAA